MALLDHADRTGMVRRLPEPLWDRLRDICSAVISIGAGQTMTPAGAPLDKSALLLEGTMTRYIAASANRRLMVALQVPGDFVDLHAFPLGRLDHDVTAVTDARIGLFPHEDLRQLVSESPDWASALWALTLIDASIHRHWTYRLGALRALAAMANLLSEMLVRMELCGRFDGTGYPLPLSHADLSAICGISRVHVSRTLRELRDAGLCDVRKGRVEILDRAALARAGSFRPDYLFLPWTP